MKIKLVISLTIFIVIVGAAIFAVNKYQTSKTSGTAVVESNTKKSKGKDSKKSGAPLTAEEAKLKEKYNSRFTEINTLADKRLDSLLDQVQKEVKYKKENKLDTARIPQKYQAVLDTYEKQAKTQFDQIYKQLQDEAKENRVGQTYQTEFQVNKAKRTQKFQEELKKLS